MLFIVQGVALKVSTPVSYSLQSSKPSSWNGSSTSLVSVIGISSLDQAELSEPTNVDSSTSAKSVVVDESSE